jgi:16S rRNA (cytosine1402-N4)-methyltransferase
MTMTFIHKPVLLEESLEGLAIKPDGIYIDCTFGRGGHSAAILEKLNENGRLLALDKDPEAIKKSKEPPFAGDLRFCIEHDSFAGLERAVQSRGWHGKVNGILLDLGVSSPQLDDPERGFSFMKDGPLDMRMNPEEGVSAATWINEAEQADIARVLKEYGEERFAKRIAGWIVEAREKAPITTTLQLSDIVARANPKWEKKKNPATRSFQGIRIFINRELDDLHQCLDQCLEVLAIGGRLSVISFHSLEDRIVKRFIQKHCKGDELPPGVPIKASDLNQRLKKLGAVISPSEEELEKNYRARSSKLRIAEKLK